MAEYTDTSPITISRFNDPLHYADIDEYCWNIAPDHPIRVLPTVEAGNLAINKAERKDIRWGYRYLRGIGLNIEYTSMPGEVFVDVNLGTIQVSYSRVTLIFEMRFLKGKSTLIACMVCLLNVILGMLPQNLRLILEGPSTVKVGAGIECESNDDLQGCRNRLR